MTRPSVIGQGRNPDVPSPHDRPGVPRAITRTLAMMRALHAGRRTVSDLAAATGIPLTGVYRYLDYLVAADVPIESAPSDGPHAPIVYWISGRRDIQPRNAAIVAELRAGARVVDVARRSGLPTSNVRMVARRAGIPPRVGIGSRGGRYAEITAMLMEGARHRDIARALGVTPARVSQVALAAGLRKRRQ